MWERRDAYRIFLVKPEGKRPLERSKRRKDGFTGNGMVGGMYWIDLA
jgi:hypothetical protein